jgi:DinB superfamily
MTSESSSTELIDILEATPHILEEIVGAADDALFDKAWPGEWTPRVVLAHLRDDEYLTMRMRLERMLAEEQRPLLMPFDETAWAANRWTGRDALPELLADFRVQRAASIQILRRVRDEDWARVAYQPEIGELTIRTWTEHWVEHDQTHINQLRAGLGLTA